MPFNKNTKQRKIILDILNNSTVPLTAEEIFEKACLKTNKLAKTTIYRNIEYLLSTNDISRYRISDNSYSYMLNNTHEHFIRCKKCGLILPIEDCPINELEKDIIKKTGFDITDHSIEISGYCKDCKDKK